MVFSVYVNDIGNDIGKRNFGVEFWKRQPGSVLASLKCCSYPHMSRNSNRNAISELVVKGGLFRFSGAEGNSGLKERT